MRPLTVLSFVSLDGVMQAPGVPSEDTSGGFTLGGWTVPYWDDFMDQGMSEEMRRPFEMVLGRKTFEIFAGYWPQRSSSLRINQVTKYGASHTLTEHTWNKSVFLKGDAVAEIKILKQQDGPELQVHGSGNLIQSLLKHDLVDELWLKTFPVTLGNGKRLFREGTIPAAFTLTDSLVTPNGVIFANYERAGEVKTGTVGA